MNEQYSHDVFISFSFKAQCLIATKHIDEAKEQLDYILNLTKRIFAPNAKQLQDIKAIASEL